MSYIENHKPDHLCVFCHALECEDGLENLVIYRGQYAYVILNRYPYTSGHLMVVPFEHQSNLDDLQPTAREEIIELVSQCLQTLRKIYRAQGFNVGANIGSAAGAGIPRHFHFHVVPRWEGDTNFMSAVGDTRVVPEAIEETYRRVREVWEAPPQPG